jgi:protein-tyrosine phosphatase
MHCDQIAPQLYVGMCPMEAADVAELQRLGVTAVLNVQTDDDLAFWSVSWNDLVSRYGHAGIEVRRVPVRDFDHEALRRGLPECVRVLDELLRGGHTVYVHCSAGINRSPSVVIAYLHWVEGRSLDEALGHVMQCRACDPYVEAIRLATDDRTKADD